MFINATLGASEKASALLSQIAIRRYAPIPSTALDALRRFFVFSNSWLYRACSSTLV